MYILLLGSFSLPVWNDFVLNGMFLMSKLILLSEAIDELTKLVSEKYYRIKLRASIRDRYQTAAAKKGWKYTNKLHITGKYQVDPDEIYPWFNDVYKPLGKSSTELIKWKECIGYFNSQYSLNTYKQTPNYFANDEEAIRHLHKFESEIDAEKEVEISELQNNYDAEKKENDSLRNRIKELEEKEK